MRFSNEPIPEILSETTLARFDPGSPFRHREVMCKYVESIFENKNCINSIEFEALVEHVEKVGAEWVLTSRKSRSGESNDGWNYGEGIAEVRPCMG